MESASDIKIDLINLITQISDYNKLKSIYSVVQTELEESTIQEDIIDAFEIGKIGIRKEITKNQIFEEQGKQSISFNEVQNLMTNEPWEQTLEELLDTLN